MEVTKYHITPDGPRVCFATVRTCKYEHYDSQQEATEAYNTQMENDFGANRTLSKAPKVESIAAIRSKAPQRTANLHTFSQTFPRKELGSRRFIEHNANSLTRIPKDSKLHKTVSNLSKMREILV